MTETASGAGEVATDCAAAGSGGALVLETAEGFEALRCTGLAETIVYDEVPAGLSARPTLSVRTRSREPATPLSRGSRGNPFLR